MARMTARPQEERVHRCAFCGRELKRDAFSRRANPFCEVCLVERINSGALDHGPVQWDARGTYLIPTRGR